MSIPHSTDDEPNASVEELLARFTRIAHRTRRDAAEPFGLAPHHVRGLLALGRLTAAHDEVTAKHFAASLGIAARSAGDVLDALEDRGLVSRTTSTTDRRATALALTQQGRRDLAAMRTAQNEAVGSLLTPLDDEQREAFRAALDLIVTAAQRRDAPPRGREHGAAPD